MCPEDDKGPKFSYDSIDYLKHLLDPFDYLRMPSCYPAITYDAVPTDRADEPHVVANDAPPETR